MKPDKNFKTWFKVKAGIRSDLTNVEYHCGPGVSSSDIKTLERSALHYLVRRGGAEYLKPKYEAEPEPASAAMQFGTCFHSLALEPDTVDQVYRVGPDVKTRAAKEWKSFVEELDDGIIPITPREHASLIAMHNAITKHEFAKILLDPESGPVERSVYWHEPIGVLCKARPDKLNDDHHLTVDVKTAADASYSGMARAVASFGYHIQAAFYSDGLARLEPKRRRFVFVCIEKDPPYGIGIYELGRAEIEQARTVIRRMLERWVDAVKRGVWDCYPPEPRTLEMAKFGFYGRIS